MTKLQAKLFLVAMTCLFTGLTVGIASDRFRAVGFIFMVASMLLILVVSLSWWIYVSIRNARIRRNGQQVVGRIVHCTSAGYVNRVPNYQLEAELPDGTHTRLQVRTWGAYSPGQAIALIVDPRYPGHAVRPTVKTDF